MIIYLNINIWQNVMEQGILNHSGTKINGKSY